MKKKWMVWGILSFVILSFIALYHLHAANSPVVTIQNEGNIAGRKMTINLTKGNYWYHEMFYLAKISPQCTIWFEDLQGNYIATFYVSEKFYQWSKDAGDKMPNRIEALPTWWHKQKKTPITDSITAATPKNKLQLNNTIPELPAKCIIKMEINNSFDYNEHYTIDGVDGSIGAAISGQPAIIYYAMIDLNAANKEYELVAIGQSSHDGTNGEINFNTDKLTTAKEIVGKAILTIN